MSSHRRELANTIWIDQLRSGGHAYVWPRLRGSDHGVHSVASTSLPAGNPQVVITCAQGQVTRERSCGHTRSSWSTQWGVEQQWRMDTCTRVSSLPARPISSDFISAIYCTFPHIRYLRSGMLWLKSLDAPDNCDDKSKRHPSLWIGFNRSVVSRTLIELSRFAHAMIVFVTRSFLLDGTRENTRQKTV